MYRYMNLLYCNTYLNMATIYYTYMTVLAANRITLANNLLFLIVNSYSIIF